MSLQRALESYLEEISVADPDSAGAGTYAANAESILRRFLEWLEAEHEVTAFESLTVAHIRSYVETLRAQTRRGVYTESTARTYFAVVRAFLSWAVREGRLEANPATEPAATAALPPGDSTASRRSQLWTAEQRDTLEAFVRERAMEAIDGERKDRLARLREYALVAMLAYGGVRGSELLRDPKDDRRMGATWADVDFYRGTIRVLGKSQRLEDVPLPAPARTPLRRYRVALDPPTNQWPLFPTRHAPSVAACVRDRLRDRGYDETEIEGLCESRTSLEVAREYSISPPAITTEGGRSILRRLCEEAAIDGEYLKPRGARDLEEELYRRDPTTAQDALAYAPLRQTAVVVADEHNEPLWKLWGPEERRSRSDD